MIIKLKPKSEFSRNVLTLMTGTTIAQAIPIAISPILTRIYTPEDFGVFALFVAIVGFFSVIASARYEQAILIPKKDEDAINIFALGFIINLTISISLLVLVVLFHNYFVRLLNSKEISLWLYFIPLTVFFIGLFNLLVLFNNRKKEYKDIAQATIIKSIITAIIQLSVGFLKQGATGLITGQLISQIFANMKLFKNIIKDKILISKISKVKIIALAKRYKNFPKFQAPHAFLNGFSSNLPIYIFTPFFGVGIVGLYSLSTRVVFAPLMILAGASTKVYNQQLSLLYNDKKDTYTFTINLLKSLLKKILIPYILFIYFAPDIFEILFGDKWRESGIYTQILSPWLLLNTVVATIAFIPSLVDKQKKAFIVSIIQLFFIVNALYFGVIYKNIYLSLSLFTLVNSLLLLYNLRWMLNELKVKI
ncbi:oligosaccharide flippase family protein [Sulfurimonas sp. NWX79]|uniref:lipopolysaccharide biosynthesis protein n=1 Tax=Sulfurimonas sp. NWX79 TaxID=2925412 RepID=UPI003204AA54